MKPAGRSAAVGGLAPPRTLLGTGPQQGQGQRGRERGGEGVCMLGSYVPTFFPTR